MAKKKSTPQPEDSEQKALEEKIDEMLDPSKPDPAKIEVINNDEDDGAPLSGLPTKIEIKDHDEDEKELKKPAKKATSKSTEEPKDETDSKPDESIEPKGAPEVKSKKIKITHHGEELHDENPAETSEDATKENSDTNDEKSEIDGEDDENGQQKNDNDEDAPDEAQDESSETNVEESTKEPVSAEKDSKEPSDVKPKDADLEDESLETTTDPSLDEAVDDIAKEESDKLLEDSDKAKQATVSKQNEKTPFSSRVKKFFKAWWHNKLARYITILVILLVLVAAAVIPQSRYYVLNMVGVRSSASIRIFDASTLQPLKNVTVELHGVNAKTDIDGVAHLEGLRLGKTQLKISKRAFSTIDRAHTVGWGSNPLNDEQLAPTGTQYSFMITDFVTGEPVSGVEAVSDDASALSNKDGELKLTLEKPEDEFVTQIIGEGYRTEEVLINADKEGVYKIVLAPAQKHVFMTRRNGTYDVYSMYADGKDEELLLKGTGEEREDITLVPHPTRPIAALVSTRSGERNSDGYQLSSLTIIDVDKNNEPITVESSERVQIVGWEGERLVYVRIKSGTSAANPDRHLLKTYNLDQAVAAELASANYFNDVMLTSEFLLFAPSSAYAKAPAGLYRINPDGTDKHTVHGNEVWSMFRSDYESIVYTTGRDWFTFNMNDKSTEQLEGQPTEYNSRVYVDSPDGTKSVWVDQVDGKGVIMLNRLDDSEESIVVTQGGLQLPVSWLNNDTIVFRVKTELETADYVANINGGEPKKLADVTNAAGIDRWYYY